MAEGRPDRENIEQAHVFHRAMTQPENSTLLQAHLIQFNKANGIREYVRTLTDEFYADALREIVRLPPSDVFNLLEQQGEQHQINLIYATVFYGSKDKLISLLDILATFMEQLKTEEEQQRLITILLATKSNGQVNILSTVLWCKPQLMAECLSGFRQILPRNHYQALFNNRHLLYWKTTANPKQIPTNSVLALCTQIKALPADIRRTVLCLNEPNRLRSRLQQFIPAMRQDFVHFLALYQAEQTRCDFSSIATQLAKTIVKNYNQTLLNYVPNYDDYFPALLINAPSTVASALLDAIFAEDSNSGNASSIVTLTLETLDRKHPDLDLVRQIANHLNIRYPSTAHTPIQIIDKLARSCEAFWPHTKQAARKMVVDLISQTHQSYELLDVARPAPR